MYDFSMSDMNWNDWYPNNDENFEISRTFRIIDLSFNDDLTIDEETNVIKLSSGTSANDLVSNITTNGDGILQDGNEFAGALIPFDVITEGSETDILLKTGTDIIVKYYNENEMILEESESGSDWVYKIDKQYIFPISIKGDVTGDGYVRMSDIMKLATHSHVREVSRARNVSKS